METEGYSYPEAIRQLAAHAGLPMPKMTAGEEQKQRQVASLHEIMNVAKNWFMHKLYATEGRLAQEYLHKRRLGRDAAGIFGLGFAPDAHHNLRDFLSTKGVADDQMLELGLVVKNNRGQVYDKFRGRLIFPICDARGQVIGFGGRTLGDTQPKYLNSPDTPLFKKGDVLYNEHLARESAFRTGKIVVAEGYMDAIALYMAGIKEVVAPLGTAITEHQLLRIWGLAKEPVICLDGDNAGQRAMQRAANIAMPILKLGTTLQFALMPTGLDPDDVIRNEGVEKFAAILEKSQSLSDFLWNNEFKKVGIATPEARALLEKNLNSIATAIKDNSVASHYRNFFREKLRSIIFSKNKYKNNKKDLPLRLTNIAATADIDIKSRSGAETLLILVIINNPELLARDVVIEDLSAIELMDNNLDNLRSEILMAESSEASLTKENFIKHLENAGYRQYISHSEGLGLYNATSLNDIDKTLLYWQYALNNYNLSVLKEELRRCDSEITDESWKKASEMRQQVAKLEENISQLELTFVES
jgi:DNA primase